ncbi:IS3 family transposase [Microbacter margulisiae]|uniref:Transposase InsO family protein n=1 Tax=Microbacter margulisiae TaxID=1350067 RepID=A0A7W5DT20_9PORP|nr:transposase InsO family protein [Microbacter margulisiae]
MSKTSTCGLLGVSRQVYYRYCRSKQKKQDKAEQVLAMVRSTRMAMPRIGFRKLYYLLYEPLRELHIGRDKFLSILKANHMLIKPKRNYRITTDSHHRFRKHKNLVADIELTHPEQVWVSDITYIGGRDRNCYLALVTDAYSKKIMGYDVSNSLSTEGSLRALNMAIRQKRYKNKLIHHSDRGLQYCSNDYQNVLKKKKIIPSMTEHYDPYANAIAERVNGILKQEFFLEDYLVDIKTMKLLVEDAVHIYNTQRPHWSCYMKTPEQMHCQKEIKIRNYKKQNLIKASLDKV